MSLLRFFLSATTIIWISGCSLVESDITPDDTLESDNGMYQQWLKETQPIEPPVRYLVSWGNEGRGGAAKRIPGYVHAYGQTVHLRHPVTDTEVVSPHHVWDIPKKTQSTQPHKPVALIQANDKESSESPPDPMRDIYTKYCNQEALNDEETQLFIAHGGIKGIPLELAKTCQFQK